jgi:hypothetical protein
VGRKAREILVFGVLFGLPFGSAFVVEWWAAFLLCPLSVIGLVGLNETLGTLSRSRLRDRDASSGG